MTSPPVWFFIVIIANPLSISFDWGPAIKADIELSSEENIGLLM